MTKDWGEKPDKGSINKKFPKPDRELERKIDDYWGKDTEKKGINKKSLNPRGVLGRKLTLYDWGLKKDKGVKSDIRLKSWKIEVLIKWLARCHMQSYAVTCSHIEYGWGCQA